MKLIKLLFTTTLTVVMLSSCTLFEEDRFLEEITLEEVVSGYDLWYVDYHSTTGTGEVPFLSKAFTISFINGNMYANNNIADVGRTGDGLGIVVGNYNTFSGVLETNHFIDGIFDFEVYQLSANEIRIYDPFENVSYYLIGYQRDNFDYDKLFYENIEYFLQEYITWEKTATLEGNPNSFDQENYLQFTPENITTFYSSKDDLGTDIDYINYEYIGDYKVFDVQGFSDLKILELYYDGGDVEVFELTVLTDQKIELYHIDSQTRYHFLGRVFVQYLKGEKQNITKVTTNSKRKRYKVNRDIKHRRNLK